MCFQSQVLKSESTYQWLADGALPINLKVSSLLSSAGPINIPLTYDPLHPFNYPQEGPRARAFTPDVMEQEEILAFPEYYKYVQTPIPFIYHVSFNTIQCTMSHSHVSCHAPCFISIWCSMYQVPFPFHEHCFSIACTIPMYIIVDTINSI